MFIMNNALLFCVIAFFAVGSALDVQPHQDDHHGGAEHGDEGHHDGVHLYSWRWSDIYYSQTSTFSSPVLVSGLIIFAIVFKILFHHLSVLEKLLPESCVLILVGILFGLIITTAFEEEGVNPNPFPKFSANLFFNILLPPIILDSAISLYNKEFFSTFFSVIIFAVFGTLFNVLTIGLSLYGLGKSGALGGFEFTFKNVTNTSQILSVFPTEDVSKVVLGKSFTVFPESLDLFPCLTFGSLIAAVDPVAVLAIFEQIKVSLTTPSGQYWIMLVYFRYILYSLFPGQCRPLLPCIWRVSLQRRCLRRPLQLHEHPRLPHQERQRPRHPHGCLLLLHRCFRRSFLWISSRHLLQRHHTVMNIYFSPYDVYFER